MPYATQADLVPLRMTQQELVDLTDDTTSGTQAGAGLVNAAIVAACLVEASATVDSYCRQRYTTPLQPSDVIKARTLDITQYLLFTRRRTTKPNETVGERYLAAIAFLKDVSLGKASLDQPASATTPQTGSGEAIVTQIPQRFSDDNLTGWN